jgi:ubiquinone/menaquinone biosynthesis C-methylase UbiE
MTFEHDVAGHYTHGALAEAIHQALIAAGRDPGRLAPQDLAPVDEFHIGGQEATAALFAQVAPAAGQQWLDIGSGLGGTARHLALAHGCRVTGIDLTEEYVAVANDLAARVGLAGQVAFRQGSATGLPFADGSFDGASLLHVGMNIPNKAALCAEVRRVLRPGGTFVIYDVMRGAEGEPAFPVPWSSGPETSFLASPAEYRAALAAAGFKVVAERSRAEFALAFFRAMQERMAAEGRPALGLHILMGAAAGQKTANMVRAIAAGLIVPTEIIARVV